MTTASLPYQPVMSVPPRVAGPSDANLPSSPPLGISRAGCAGAPSARSGRTGNGSPVVGTHQTASARRPSTELATWIP
jgi:hypothetical protein